MYNYVPLIPHHVHGHEKSPSQGTSMRIIFCSGIRWERIGKVGWVDGVHGVKYSGAFRCTCLLLVHGYGLVHTLVWHSFHWIGSLRNAFEERKRKEELLFWSKGRAQLDSDFFARIVDVSGSEGRDHSLRISTYMFKL